ncbi:MAG: ATP-binding cassette domain-containing protein [Planctomycetes bacterium]|nr:ATP-binding cassette domain-containing protein [Planctomycetota bacterium]
MLEARGATKRYGDVVALDGVNLKPAPGRTTVLIGPSGCGKSTLLRAFIGLVRLDDGGIHFDGEVLTPETARPVRRRVGYVIQSGGLFPHLTARRNVTLAADYFHSFSPGPRVDELCALVRLDASMLDRYPAELSGGQRQRVGLMRALMLDPEVLLLDEPLGALDPLVRSELQTDLRDIFRQVGKTVVMVTHDLAEAAHFADHLVLMRDGKIEQQGRLKELTDQPASDFVREFVTAQRKLHSTEAAG